MFQFMKKKIELFAPAKCQVIPIHEVEDAVFSQKVVGDGCAILPYEDMICSPVNGEVTLVFRTNHAIGIKSEEGIELLIHIGIDTVELKGEGFENQVKLGDQVKIGTPLSKIDRAFIKDQGKSLQTPIVITNDYHVIQVEKGEKNVGALMMKVVKNN